LRGPTSRGGEQRAEQRRGREEWEGKRERERRGEREGGCGPQTKILPTPLFDSANFFGPPSIKIP